LKLPGVASVEETSDAAETRVRVECSDTDLSEEVFRLAVSQGWVLRELSPDVVSLEDVFVRLTRHESAAADEAAEAAGPAPAPEEGAES